MDEILALQKQLAAVQLEGTATRLSERNCVELVSKLIGMGLIDVVFTQSGREYLTRARLRQEVADEVTLHGGRVNVVEIAALIGVDLHHVEVELSKYLEEHKDTVQLTQGQVITNGYLDSAAEEVAEMVGESGDGSLSLADIATHFGLPIEMITTMVQARIGSKIPGKLEDGKVYTALHLERTKARVRGILSGAASPLTIGDVAATLHVRVGAVLDATKGFLASGRLQGELRGRGERAVYTPAIFGATRTEAVRSFFRANQYVDLERLAQLSISDPAAFAAEHLPDSLVLNHIVLSRGVLEQLEDAMAGAVAADSWLDALPLLPPVVQDDDAAEIVAKCAASVGGEEAVVLDHRFVVSRGLVRRCHAVFATDSETKAVALVSSVVPGTATKPEEAPTKKAAGKSRRRRAKGDAAAAAPSTSSSASTSSALSAPTEEEAARMLQSCDALRGSFDVDHLGEEGGDSGVLVAIAAHLEGDLDSLYASAEATARERLARERAHAEKVMEKQLTSDLQRIELHSRAIATLSNGELREVLDRHLAKTLARHALLCALNYLNGTVEEDGGGGAGRDSEAIGIESRLAMLSALAKRHLKPIQSAATAAAFLEQYDENARELGLPARIPLDKRKDRTLATTLRAEASTQLASTDDPIHALCLAATLMYVKHSKGGVMALLIPPRALPLMAEELESTARGGASESAFFALHKLLLVRLKGGGGGGGGDDGSPGTDDDPQPLDDALRALKRSFEEVVAA